jgi:uncharacterized protein
MTTKIFVNIPVKDLNRSKNFFSQLGYRFNRQFTDEKAACMVISDDIYVMLLTNEFFKTFIKNDICDTTKCNEAILSLSSDSREKVDELVTRAIKAGGKGPTDTQDHGSMYQSGFKDLDGHLWEVIWMDPSTIKADIAEASVH